MTLRQQFDDAVHHLLQNNPPHCEGEFAEVARRCSALPGMLAEAGGEIARLRTEVATKERELAKTKASFTKQRLKVDLEKLEKKEAKKEKKSLEKLLENVRGLVYGKEQANTTSAEILSIIDSAGMSSLDSRLSPPDDNSSSTITP